MNNYWSILNIAPTNDEKTIKKAYAKQLKTIDQEEQPQQFIQLREAYDWIIQYGRFYDHDHEDYGDEDDWYVDAVEPDTATHHPALATQAPVDAPSPEDDLPTRAPDPTQDLLDAVYRFRATLHDPVMILVAVRLFEEILQKTKTVDLDTQMRIQDYIEDVLAEHDSPAWLPLLKMWQQHSDLQQIRWSDRASRQQIYARLYPIPPASAQPTQSSEESFFQPWMFFVLIILGAQFLRHCDFQHLPSPTAQTDIAESIRLEQQAELQRQLDTLNSTCHSAAVPCPPDTPAANLPPATP